jgi:tubulin polyglutamylase TTLL6/13
MQSCRYKDGWSLLWGDTWDAVSTVTPKRFQRVNHFPGMSSICRKDLLGKNLSRLGSDFPTEYVWRS